MVRLLLLCSLVSVAHAEPITADQLENWAGVSDQQTKASEQRLKAADLSSTFYKTAKIKRRVYYRTPDGGLLVGFLLPNGKITPAYFNEMKQERAGCLASDGQVYPATWTGEALVCELPQIGTIEINNASYTVNLDQAIADQKQQLKGTKYGPKKQKDQTPTQPLTTRQKPLEKTREKARINPPAKKNKANYMTAVNPIAVPSTTYTMQADQKSYGIPFGRWFKARLTREVTNGDNGQIELILDETVVGKKRDLTPGTILFANKGFNPTTGRMDLTINRAITPEDKKLRLAAVVYDENKVSGLSGTLVRNRPAEMKSMMNQSAIQLAGTVLDSTTNSTIPGDSVNDFADNVLANEKRFLAGLPDALIKVKPQITYVRVIESF